MVIPAIQPISPAALGQTAKSSAVKPGQQTSFAEFLGNALNEVNQMSQNANQLAQSYATGGSVTAAQLMIAEQKASLGVDMVAQVNNRVQEAYRTIMNMQV